MIVNYELLDMQQRNWDHRSSVNNKHFNFKSRKPVARGFAIK